MEKLSASPAAGTRGVPARAAHRSGIRLPALLLTVAAAVLAFDLWLWDRERAFVGRMGEALVKTEAILLDLFDAESAQRGYLLTGNDLYLGPYHAALPRVEQDLDRLSALLGPDLEAAARLDRVQQLVRTRIEQFSHTIALRRDGRMDEVAAYVSAGRGKSTMDAVRAEMTALKTETGDALAEARQREWRWTAALSVVALAFSALACFTIGARAAARQRGETLAWARLNDLLAASPAGICFLDRDLRFLQMNPALAAMGDQPAETYVGRSVWDFAPAPLRSRLEPLLRSVVDEGRIVTDIQVEAPSERHGGETRHFVASYFPLRSADGRIDGAGAVLADVTDFKRAQDGMRRSEALKAAILESALDCIITIDEDSRIVEFNPAAEQTFGIARDAALGQPMAELIVPPEHRDAHYAGLSRYLGTGEGKLLGKRIEVMAMRADGSRFPAELAITATRVRDETRFTAYLRDITKRRAAENALLASEERFRSLVLATSAIVWTTPASGEFDLAQPSWSAFTGQSAKQLSGWGWADAIHPDDRAPTLEAWKEALRTCSVLVLEHRVRRHDGEYRYMLVRAVPVLESDGSVREWIGIHTDITERRRAEEDLEAAKEAAEAANRAKSQFLANMSHELRTPLSAVIGYTEMLEEEVEDMGEQSLLDDLRKIGSNARHLLSLINDVLDISKIEAGRMEVHAETFDVAPMLEEVAATARALVEKKGNRLELSAPPDLARMRSDIVKVRQCLFNLLGNAAKFTENGSIRLEAERVTEDGREMLLFHIRDTGIGMSEEQLGRLFRRFSQADSSTTRRYGGTGLGLAITKAFCTLLGGDIRVESRPGEGSSFTIRLPAELAITEEEPEPQDAGETENLILVIDDDPAVRDLICRFLRREGFAVRTAADGEAGLRLARELRPHAILLDVMMPRMDGWAVLSALKADPDLAEIPVTMISFVENRAFGQALGAAEYLPKPIDWGRLKAVLDRYRCPDRSSPVLVVEDQEDMRTLLRDALLRDGWTVVEAANGREALERMAETRPELILLDLTMPVMNGFAFVEEMRRRPEWRSIPVVVVTAKDLTAAERASLRGPVRRIIQKDEDAPEDLIAEVRRTVAATAAPCAPKSHSVEERHG